MENFWPTFMHQQQYFFSASNIILAISKGWLELKDALYIFYFPFQLAFFSGKLIPSWILSRRWPYLFHIVSWFAFNLIAFWIRLKSLKDLDHEMLNAMKRLTHTEKMSAVTEKAWLILIPEMFLSFVKLIEKHDECFY